ncbi:MAG: glycosyltransferase family 8 protein [Treponemataceae bacterium]|nr:MAG: glycosyltransferase family 8 protein [Treponemataceae bacterium]
MDLTLNVLYQSDDTYAPITGVSILSLFKTNSRDRLLISIYCIDDGLSEENRNKIIQIVEENHGQITFLDLRFAVKLLQESVVDTVRGRYTAYLKLFAIHQLPQEVKRIMSFDSDTIVVGDVYCQMDIDLYGNIIGAERAKFYCNKGKKTKGLVFDFFSLPGCIVDVARWKNEDVHNSLLSQLSQLPTAPFCNDEGLVNFNEKLRGRIMPIHPKFNIRRIYSLFSSATISKYFRRYTGMYSPEELEEIRKDPRVYHCMGVLLERPWHKNSIHPDVKMFDDYIAMSPWKGTQKKKAPKNFVFAVGKILYYILPRPLFGCIYAWQTGRLMTPQTAELLVEAGLQSKKEV